MVHRTLGILFLVGMGALPASSDAQPTALPDTLTFERAVALFQEHNPQLRAARARARAEGQAARAASRFPNPTLSVSEERTNLPNGVDDQWYAGISQPLRYPGEQAAYNQSAAATRQAAEAQATETQVQLFNTLRHRYLDVVAARTRLDVLDSFASSVRTAARTARIRYEEGDLSTFQRSRLQVAQAQYENDRAEAERALHEARVGLAYVLLPDAHATLDAADAMSMYRVAGRMQFQPVSVRQEAALQRALQERAAVRSARAEVDARTADLDAARYRRYPSLSVSAGPKRQSVPSSTTYGYTAGISIGLPLWNGGQAAVDAERNRREAATARLEATRRHVEGEVHQALQRLNSYRGRIQSVADTVLAGTDSLAADAQFVYQEGEISLFELLDAIDAARQAALLRVDLTAGYLRALYDLEAALGVGPADAPLVVEGALHPRSPDLLR